MIKCKNAAAVLVVAVSAMALSGCQKQEGPAEKAGKQIDKAMSSIGEQIQKAGDKIKDAARDMQK
jgi:predicted small secreted protein